MSIFTKIFVVLVMVLSVLLVALLVPFVINTEDYRGQLQNEQQQRQLAERRMSSQASLAEQQIDSVRQTADRLRAQISDQQRTISSLERNVNERERTIAQLRNDNADVRSQLARFSSGLEQAAQINAMLQDEVRTRREGEVRLQTQAIELSDRLQQQETQVSTLERQVRLMREHNEDLSRENEQLMARVETFARPDVEEALDGGFDPENVIRARVTQVQQIGDQSWVALNVGSNDGVREGMRFTIHTGERYFADVVIMQVDETTSAGHVILQRREIEDAAEATAGLR